MTDMETDDEEKTYFIEAMVPAVRAKDFVNKVRDHTSGNAHPQFSMSHYEVRKHHTN